MKNAAYQIIQGKGATNYAIGLATARILEALLHDENRVLPVSSLLNDYHGIADVCLSVPTVVGPGRRAAARHPDERRRAGGAAQSADRIRATARDLGF